MPMRVTQFGSTIVEGNLGPSPGGAFRDEAMRLVSAIHAQLKPAGVAAGAADFSASIDGGQARFQVSTSGDRAQLLVDATGANGKATVTLEALQGDARSELRIAFEPKAGPSLEMTCRNGEPPTWQSEGKTLTRGQAMDYLEAHGSLALGDAPNTRTIFNGLAGVTGKSPLFYAGNTEILKSLLLGASLPPPAARPASSMDTAAVRAAPVQLAPTSPRGAAGPTPSSLGFDVIEKKP